MLIAEDLAAGVSLQVIQIAEAVEVLQQKVEERIRTVRVIAIPIPGQVQGTGIIQEPIIPVVIKDLPLLLADPILQAAEAVLLV